MSSSLPGIFMPTIIDNCCYIDGGVMCNYPLNQCLRDHTNKDEILGIKSFYSKDSDKFSNVEVTAETSLLEYVICMSINSMNYIRDSVKMDNIENTIRCCIKDNPLTLDAIQESVKNQDLRRQWIKMGEEDAIEFLSIKNNSIT
jgi:predicted acylesterase/phospholipase RssA